MGNIGFYALRDLGLALRDEFKITTFIETGTFKGQTTCWAAGEFKKVKTIEADKSRYEKARKSGLDNVKYILGDSREVLPKVLPKKPALLWLDAHYCGNETKTKPEAECPLLDELKALQDHRHFILIDDARFFVEPRDTSAIRGIFDFSQWPTLSQIKELLPEGYQTVIWQDCIIAVPDEAMPVVERFTRESEVDIVVLTSNKYVHALPAFAHLFNKFWDAGQAVKVVRYDVRPPKLPGNFSTFAVGNQEDYNWSDGLIRYLQFHNSDLILLMLEDYFIDRPVNTAAIHRLWNLMERQPEIAKLDLSGDRLKVAHQYYTDDLVSSDDSAPFQTSLQAAIWRKDFLLDCLKPDETPWQFEKIGTKRLIHSRKAGLFNGLILGHKKPPVSYINAKGGEGTQPEKWALNRFPDWMANELRSKGLR